MPDSITISHSFAQDIKCALDDALRCINVHETDGGFDPQKAIGGIVRVRAELVGVLGNSAINGNGNCSRIEKRTELKKVRDELLTLARRIEQVEKAA